MTRRQERLGSVLKDLAGSFIKTRAKTLAIITPNRTEISSDLKSAKIFISVFPENNEKEILALLKKDENKFKNYIKTRVKIKFLPDIFFELDQGAKTERRIDELLKKSA